MVTACIAAAFYHLFNATSVSDGVVGAAKKSQVLIAVFFIASHFHYAGLIKDFSMPKKTTAPDSNKLATKKTK